MRKDVFRSKHLAQLLIFMLGLVARTAVAHSSLPAEQVTSSLQEQIQARYPLADMSTAGGCTIRKQESALVVMQPGIPAFEESSFPRACSIHYKDGKIKPPGFKCRYTGYYGASSFGKGDKVYPIDLKIGKDEISMTLGYCSSHGSLSFRYKTVVVFEFSSTFLSAASAQQVEEKIGELLSKDLTKAAASPAQLQHAEETPQNGSPKSAAEPQSVKEGMSPEEVAAILGKPDIIVEGGNSKLIYVYNAKKLKIVFLNNKMSDFE